MSNTIHPSLLLSSTQTEREVKGGGFLGKDEFLKILMAQLQNQDPMNPMEDKEFIAQMASFSSLEQMMNLSQSFEKFLYNQQESTLLNYQQLLGKQVSWIKVIDSEGEPQIVEGKGKIQGIEFVEGTIQLSLEDGTTITPSELTEINQFSNSQSIVEASHMIGLEVAWKDENGEEMVSIVQAVSYKNGEIKFVLEGDQTITGQQIIRVQGNGV